MMHGLPTREYLLEMVASLSLKELMDRGLQTKLKYRSRSFSLCTISNVRSGGCTEDCAYCAQSSKYRTDAPCFPIKSDDEILKEAKAALDSGAKHFSLVSSGRGLKTREVARFCKIIDRIKNEIGISCCASLGIVDRHILSDLAASGLDRYHHNLETSENFFKRICTTHTWSERVNTIYAAKDVGLEVCSGGIIGLGEDMQERIDLAMSLAGIGVDSVPLNILVPIPGTPLEHNPVLSVEQILISIAMFRLVLPHIPIRIAGGRETALSDLQCLAFMSGADGMLIGGYLTVRGRPVEQDQKMVKQVIELWQFLKEDW